MPQSFGFDLCDSWTISTGFQISTIFLHHISIKSVMELFGLAPTPLRIADHPERQSPLHRSPNFSWNTQDLITLSQMINLPMQDQIYLIPLILNICIHLYKLVVSSPYIMVSGV